MKYMIVYSMQINNSCIFGNMFISQADIGTLPVKSQQAVEAIEASLLKSMHYKCTVVNIIPMEA